MRTVAVPLLFCVVATVASNASAQACDPVSTGDAVQSMLDADALVDAHLLALLSARTCADLEAPARGRLVLLDAVALVRLDEGPRARRLLDDVRSVAGLSTHADALLAWSYVRSSDEDALHVALDRLAPEPRARIVAYEALPRVDDLRVALRAVEPALVPQIAELYRAYDSSQTQSPVLSGILSALLPGAGQAYNGAWEGALVSFLLSAVFITATVELADKELYFTAVASGLAASVFYVGNILNAVDLANRANEVASDPYREAIERRLVPELRP